MRRLLALLRPPAQWEKGQGGGGGSAREAPVIEACAQLGRQCSVFPGLKAAFTQAEGPATLLELLEERPPKVRNTPRRVDPHPLTLCWAGRQMLVSKAFRTLI